mmetsp:Transcript_941/g.1992  ORF Transcript_941/g.1992 Transcript_941/m.1992 type:complete len:247 (-) Transcript_941:51-791(-)
MWQATVGLQPLAVWTPSPRVPAPRGPRIARATTMPGFRSPRGCTLASRTASRSRSPIRSSKLPGWSLGSCGRRATRGRGSRARTTLHASTRWRQEAGTCTVTTWTASRWSSRTRSLGRARSPASVHACAFWDSLRRQARTPCGWSLPSALNSTRTVPRMQPSTSLFLAAWWAESLQTSPRLPLWVIPTSYCGTLSTSSTASPMASKRWCTSRTKRRQAPRRPSSWSSATTLLASRTGLWPAPRRCR